MQWKEISVKFNLCVISWPDTWRLLEFTGSLEKVMDGGKEKSSGLRCRLEVE